MSDVSNQVDAFLAALEGHVTAMDRTLTSMSPGDLDKLDLAAFMLHSHAATIRFYKLNPGRVNPTDDRA